MNIFRNLSTKIIPKNLNPKFNPNSKITKPILNEIDNFKLFNDYNSIPSIINGKTYLKGENKFIYSPYDTSFYSGNYYDTPKEILNQSVNNYSSVKKHWNNMDLDKRLEIFLTAADKIEGKYYNQLIAATIVSQNKTPYEAEIDAICELADFLRFNVDYVTQIYQKQPISPDGYSNISQYQPLNGFIAAITPFNFTAIAGNLATSPLMLGNKVIWKPSDNAVLSNYLVWEILVESGMPPEICDFVPMNGEKFFSYIKEDKNLSAITFTGSSQVFNGIYKEIGNNIEKYDNYPRLIGETGGKNFHFIDTVDNNDINYIDYIVNSTFESAYNYSGQKCSACSRVYIPEYLYPIFIEKMEEKKNELLKKFIDKDLNYGLISYNSFKEGQNIIESIIKNKETNLIFGGCFNNKTNYFMEPTLVECKNHNNHIFHNEFFKPILSVYTYKKEEKIKTLNLCKENKNNYALTGAIFSKDLEFIEIADDILKYSAGNFYVNDKSTGAVVGQQPFGGSGKSGTNDKAGDINVLYKYLNQRNIKINNSFN